MKCVIILEGLDNNIRIEADEMQREEVEGEFLEFYKDGEVVGAVLFTKFLGVFIEDNEDNKE